MGCGPQLSYFQYGFRISCACMGQWPLQIRVPHLARGFEEILDGGALGQSESAFE
jgi:hypothetical protein